MFWLGFGYVQVGFSCWGWGQMFAMVIFRGGRCLGDTNVLHPSSGRLGGQRGDQEDV